MTGKERLHKVLAARGVASRRASEELIFGGHVMVDGRIVRELGSVVSADADIQVDGQAIHERPKAYYMLNKPHGYVTTLHDDRGRPCVGDLTGRLKTRVYPVGRLDAETEGLLLLTSDGEMTNILTHPRFEVEKTYLVSVSGLVAPEALEKLRTGLFLREGRVSARVKVLRASRETTRLEMMIHQGYNRQIRRMLAAVGYNVKRLERIRFGPLRLKKVPRGAFRQLTPEELRALRRLVDDAKSGVLPHHAQQPAAEAGGKTAPREAQPGGAVIVTRQAGAKEKGKGARKPPAGARGGSKPFGLRKFPGRPGGGGRRK